MNLLLYTLVEIRMKLFYAAIIIQDLTNSQNFRKVFTNELITE